MIFTHDDYTVAWICALPLEMAAANVMLDETHPSLRQPKSDHNVYTLGSVSDHNVVIACLPSGIYGTTSAAIVLANMLATFPSLQFGLMVGIGGGVPNKNADIRLGDVVVSIPTDNSGGLIQYDFGKTLHNGRFHRTGSLNKPPQFLLTTVSQMQSNSLLGERPIAGVLSAAFKKSQEIRDQFARPNEDWLFDKEYEHESSNADCSNCDPAKLIARPPRGTEEPHIHYGLIASGNQVMKDAGTRDSLAEESNILCFEMEAAGLVDQIPCLVIRGICDYCDSHKHKNWQAYAAFVAAAYARTLLMLMPSRGNTVDTTRTRTQGDREGYWMVPFQRNWRIVGREKEITKIESLIDQTNGPSRIAICGLGGIGKTQISLEVAYRMRQRDPNCSIFWIACSSYETVEQGYSDVAQRLGLQDQMLADAKERVKTFLSQNHADKWLLIFDNADDLDMWIKGNHTVPALKRFLPQSQHGRILFTTRNLPELEMGASIEMLENSLVHHDQCNSKMEVAELVEQLACLPLAITQAAAYINENETVISTYTKLLQAQESRVIELLSEDFEDEGRYETSRNPIAATWWISFQQIQHLNPLAADYLQFIACINPRDIPQSLLPQPASENERIKAIGILTAYSFVKIQTKSDFLSMHRLVHLATRNWLRKNERFCPQLAKTAHRLNEIFPNSNDCNRTLWREYLPHCLLLIQEDEFRKDPGDYIDLLERIGRCLYHDGRFNEAEKIDSQTLETQMILLGPEHPHTLASMGNLALTYQSQGRWKEAEEREIQVLKIRKQVLGPDHLDTIISMGNLALTYQNQNRLKEAEELQTQVMEIRKQVLGPEHPDTLTRRWKEAEELGLVVSRTQNQVLGSDHPHTLISMENLAMTYQNQQRWTEAEDLEAIVVQSRKIVLGARHPKTLISMGTLASIYLAEGRWKEAEELGVQVLEICQEVMGPSHPDTRASMNNLAMAYQNQGRWKDAEEVGVRLTGVCESVLGPEHPDTISSMVNLALIYLNQGRRLEAAELEESVLERRRRTLGLVHPSTLTSMINLAPAYLYIGRWKEAEDLGFQAMVMCKQVLGPEHPETLTSTYNLAYIWKLQGRNQDALHLLETCATLRCQILGPDHPSTITSYRSLRDFNIVQADDDVEWRAWLAVPLCK
ncbi:violaceus kinesin [Aspergillus ambiguus]|uniref:violaceus kinesin n=1 Tax=Aspergillus ambiguus TaxID=176160 RepID=UPI003CCCF282